MQAPRIFLFLTLIATLAAQPPRAAVYPGAVATDSDLLVAADNAHTTLSGAIDATQTAITLQSAAGFETPLVMTIGSEQLRCASHATNVYTCSRGFNGSIATAHGYRAPVEGNVTAARLDRMAAEIKSIEAAVGPAISDLPYTSFAAACAAAASKGVMLLPTKTYTSLTSMTCGAPAIDFRYGGKLQPAGAGCGMGGAQPCVVTLPQRTIAPPSQQICDVSRGGNCVFSIPPAELSPPWWGADASGNADSAPACSALSAAARSTQGSNVSPGSRILWPPGTYKFSSTCTISGFEQLEFAGSNGSTVFTWAGGTNTTGPLFRFEGITQLNAHDFSASIGAANPINASGSSAVIQVLDGSGGYATSTAATFRDVWVQANGHAPNGFLFNGTDNNNDFHRLDRVRVTGATSACFYIQGSQAYAYRFNDSFCGLGNSIMPLYGVETSQPGGGTGSFGGTFSWQGGGMTTQNWDFYIQSTQDFPVHVENLISESCGGLLSMPAGSDQLFTVSHSRWVRVRASDGCTNTGTDVVNIQYGYFDAEDTNFETMSAQTDYKLTFTYATPSHYLPWMHFRRVVIGNENFTFSQLFPGWSANLYWPTLDSVQWNGARENERGPIEVSTYSAGTVTSSGSSATITGSGTSWTSAMQGGYIRFGGKVYRVSVFNSATSLTLDSAPPAASAVAYSVGYGGSSSFTPLQQVATLNAGTVTANTATVGTLNATNTSGGVLSALSLDVNHGERLQLVAQTGAFAGPAAVTGGTAPFLVNPTGVNGMSVGIDGKRSGLTEFEVGGLIGFMGANSKGSTPTTWGSNCPAITCSAPYTWFKAIAADGSVVWIPVFK
jgi:hypothetical protein